MNKQWILDDHLFNADFANLTNNDLRQMYSIEDVCKLMEDEVIQ